MVVHGPGGTPCSCLSLPTMYNVSRCRFLPFRQPTLFSYFRVPEECKDLWLRPNGLQWKHVKNLFICSKHFESKCFSPTGRLLRSAQPTIVNLPLQADTPPVASLVAENKSLKEEIERLKGENGKVKESLRYYKRKASDHRGVFASYE